MLDLASVSAAIFDRQLNQSPRWHQRVLLVMKGRHRAKEGKPQGLALHVFSLPKRIIVDFLHPDTSRNLHRRHAPKKEDTKKKKKKIAS